MNELPQYNTGLIEGSGTPSLYIGGTIPYEVVNESGDWRPYVVRHEKQKDPLETMACVSFSCNNCLEIQYNFFGIDKNFSDRFLAEMSGTTPQGNYLDKVADTARIVGLVDEMDYPNVPKATTWDEYYKTIPMEIINKAVPQPISFERVSLSDMEKELKQCPLQVTIIAPHPNHAVTLLHIEGDKAYIQDHYNLQTRKISRSSIAYALKIVLNKPNMTNSLIVKNGAEFGIYDPATSEDGLITLMRNRGMNVPLKVDGSLDWDKIKIDKNLV